MKKLQRKALSVFLALVLLCGLFPTAYAAEQTAYSDTHGHWAEDAIARWSDYGIVQGNNGKFDPDSSMTRAQAAMVFAKLLGLEQTADLSAFADVPADAWYTDAMAKCYAAGILKGVAADRLNPEGTITREMFFVMFARAMGIEEETELNKEFSDAANISSWARGSVYALINHGYVNGVNETAIGPDNLINRASVMALLDQAITEYTVENGKPVITLKDAVQKEEEKKPTSGGGGGGGGSSGGSSGNNGGDTPPSYEDLTVSEAGTIITGGTYRNVTIAPSVGDGEVALNGVTITGNLVVQGGGSNSIKLNNCTVGGKVVLDKDAADPEAQQPRLELTDTPVSTVEVAKPAILEATDGNSAVAAVEAKANVEVKGAQTAVATVTVPATAEAPVAVTVTAGTVDKVEAKSETTVNAVGTVTAVAAEAPVTVASGSVETVTVPATVTEPVTVTVSNSASVETVDAKGATTVSAEANALVGTVAAEAPVTVSSGTVNTITVPPTASESVAITVGSGATVAEVTVRSDKGTTITNNGTVSNVSAASETIKESVAATGTPEVVSHIHIWDGGIVTTPASCTTTGSKTFECTVDGCTSATKVEAIPATGHNWSDWTENQGADTHTRVCQNDSQHTETADHAWDNGVVTKAATCAEKGVKTYTCSTCAAAKTEEIGMLPHTEVVDAAKAPSCEETGLTEGKHCSVCSAVIVAQTTVDALGHDFTVAQYDNSQHWKKCSRCDATDTKADHSYAAHNCDAAAKCQDCEYVKPAGAHSYGAYEQTKAPTCTEKGSEKAVCSVCNHEITRDVDALGHNYGAAKYTWTKSDNDTGYTCAGERVCANDASHKDQATATVASAVTKPATCTEKGETTYTATFEKDGFAQQTKTEEIPAKGHTEVIDAAVEATCTTPGKTEGKHCSVCNAVLVAQEEIPAKGHTWDNGVVTTPPTETTEGVKTYTCTVCGETRTEAIPATGGSAETISNIRFEKSDGQLYLKWDGQETDNLKYNIYLTKDGGQNWTKITSTSQLHLTMQLKDAGTYNGVKIVPRIDGVEDQSKACVDTSVLLTIGAETGTAPTKVTFTYNATKSEEWGYTENGAGAYDYTITGLTPNTPYQMEMKTALDATSVSSDGSTSNTAGTGSGTSGGSKLKTCVEQGYYRIYEFTNVQVDSSGKTVSYTATSRGDWTKCTPSASDAQQLLADAKDANLLTWLTLTEAQLPVNVTRLDMAKLVAAYMNLPVTPVPEAGFMFSDCTNANGLGDTDRGVVKAVVDAQIIMGTSSGTFDPDGTVTRAQIAELLRRMLNVPATGGTVPFTDVPSDYWAYPSIATLYNLGLISGTSPTTFEPNLIASKEAALRLLLNAKGWTDPRTPVAAVSGFTFVKTDDTLRTKITKPDVGAIECFEFAFLNSTDGQWKYVGGCGAQDNGIPIYADLPTGTYTKVRVTSIPNDWTANLPADAEFNCNLTITNNVLPDAPNSVVFSAVTDNNGNSGYSVTVKGLALATKQTVVVLAERKNGDGRRGNMSGDKFSDVTPSDKSVTITIYDQFDACLIPNGYYQVLEVLGANVGGSEVTGATDTTATLKVNARGGWGKVSVGPRPAQSSISNIHFVQGSDGIVALEWDFTRGTDVGTSSVMFRVIAEGPNGEHVNCGTGRTEAHLTFPAGTYTSFTVKAVDMRNQNTVFATATESLTMNVASGATSNTASAAFTKDGTEYQTVISGLSGYLAYHIYVEVPDGNGIRRSGSFGPVENAGSAMGYLPAEDIEAAGAKYSIYGVKAYKLDNGVLSYTIDCLREPTAIPAMPATTYTFTIAMQKATNDGQYHPSINGQSTNNVRKMQFENEVSVSHAALPTDYTRNRGGNIYFENCVFEEDVQVTYNDAFSYSVEFENCEFRNGAKVVVVGPTNLIQPGDGEVAPQTEIRFWECGGAAVESTTAPVEVSGTGSFTLNGMNVTAAEDTNASAAGNHYASVMYWPYAHETFYELVAEGRYSLTVSGAEATADTLRVSGNVDLSGFAPHSKQTIELHCWNDVSNINLGANKAVIEQPGVYNITTADNTLNNVTIAVTDVTVNGTQVNPACTISNIRFKTKGNYWVLAWDSDMGSYPHYQIYYRNSETGEWEQEAGTDDTFLQVISGRGTAGVRVEAWIYDRVSDQEIMIGACENTALKIEPEWSQAAAAATVEFVADTAAASGYRVKIDGIPSGINYLFLHMEKGDNGDGLLIKHNGAATYEMEVPEWCKDVLPCDEYILNSYGSFALSDDDNTLSYTVTELAVSNYLPATSSISNIRFVQGQDGIVALEWDFTRGTDIGSDEVRFEVVASNSSDSSVHWSRETREFTMPMTALAGNYDTVTVNALNIKQGNSFITSDTKNLTVNAAVGTTANPNNASATFTDLENDKATANLSGLTGYQAFQMYVVDAENDRTKISAGTVSEDGTATVSVNADVVKAPGAVYSIYGVKAYTLNNGVLSYTIDCLREPTATLPAESGAPSNLHFELNQQGRFLLKWDGEEKTGVSYHLYRTSDGGNSWINCGNYSTAQAMPIFSSGNFNGFKVVPCLDNVEDESKALIDLTMRLDITPKTGTTVPTLSLARDDAKSQSFNYGPEGGYYNYSISGLAPNAAFQLYLSPDKKVSVARMGVAGENGSLISSIQGSGIKANVEGYCMVYQYTDTQIQDSGKTCTYTVTKMSDWVSVADMACQHQWDEGVVTQKPTGQNTGVKTYTCQKCGLTRTEVIPVLTEPYLTVEGGSVILHWKAELDSSEYCYINGERASKSMMNGWYYYGIPSDITESQSIVIGKGTDSEQTEVLYTLKDAVNVTILPEQNFTITGLENGKYQIAAPGMNTDGFYFKSSVKDKDKKLGENSSSTFDGVVEMSPWDGCTVDVFLSKASVNDAQNVVTIEKTPVTTVTEITHYVPADVAEVSTFDDMVAALKRGGTVRLMADITETKTYSEIETGPAATLELDGHTLNLSTYLSFNWGKDLTIIGNNASGARGQINGEIRIQNGAQLHVTGGQYEKFYCYRARDVIMEDAIIEYNGTNSNGAVSMYSCDTVELRNCNVTAETTQALDITQSGAVTLLGGSYQSTSTSYNTIEVDYCTSVRAENVTASSTGGSAATYGYTPSIVVEGGSYTSTSTSYAALYVYNNEGEAYVRGTSDQPLQVSGVKCALECRVKNVWITDVNASGQCTGNLVSVQGASYGEQNAVITRLTANGGKYALNIGSIYDVTVDSCVLNAAADQTDTYGLSIMGRSNYSGSKAVVKATSASGDYGIRVDGCDNLQITNSTATGSKNSLYLNDCTNASVTGGELNGNVHLANQSQQPIEYTLSNLNVNGCLEAIGNYGSAKTDVELSDCNFVALAADEAVVYADNLAYITISGGSYTACNEDGYVLKSNPYSSNSACITVNGGSFRNTAASANVFAPLNNDVTDARYVVNGGSFSAALSGVSGITVNGNVNTSTDEGGETVYTVTVV